MRLSQKAITEFKNIYRQEFGRSISDDEARQEAENFMSLMEIILRPIPDVDCPFEENKTSG